MWKNHAASIKGDPVNPALVKCTQSEKSKKQDGCECVCQCTCVSKITGLYRDLIREK